ncbi:mitochondrion biogenesis protein (Mdm31), putative [Talaromyces stipitatus ATCC 10500]|uniref:Mitochondrion biogenesis protein (Mdm31), putative n=1 Tax=Talaromyces stipitatus (strain ATCC 10500 / CBS 375.48 / QM 6759 / NRRL 1006) TaxID=441959 RepID=B8M7E2_TALSN|nr:mitochondrion biogenesis protein (Mdm31), putative [Talaromyces stipitatus ATCC 10500]EED20362.1 mitochondrion biogenesis protein (Mdm31), putative [Talaromyces stipitatus ATCC 10500]
MISLRTKPSLAQRRQQLFSSKSGSPSVSLLITSEFLVLALLQDVTERMSHTIGHQLNVFRQAASPFLFYDARISVNIGLAIQFRRSFITQSPYRSGAFHDSQSRNHSRISGKLASGSLLLLGLSTSSVVENGATRTAVVSSGGKATSCAPKLYQYSRQGVLSRSSRQIWKRALHTKRDDPTENPSNDSKSDKVTQQSTKEDHGEYSLLHRNIRERLPNLHQFHRPTKEELLAAATGFWSRLRVRFKWFSIRSVRPFNLDEIGALFSWVLLGHVLWVILGTTTFFSLIILTINTVFAQETLARWVGNYLTSSSGVQVVFESAIVPKWRDGVITFKNVFVSRRPGHGHGNVSKGSSKTAAAAAAAAAASDAKETDSSNVVAEEDTNYTQFDVSIDTVNVTLSFTKWFNGKGLLRDVEVKGIRGVIDRTHVHWTDDNADPKSYRHEHNPGDFEIDSFKMEDLLVTVYQPNNFRPFAVSIFSCDLPQLRKQWLFYDFMSANMMSGSFDNSLFTIHPRQTNNFTGAQLTASGEETVKGTPWKKQSRIRIDSLNIDHLNRGVEGPFSWIHEGAVDIVADIMLPADDNESLAKFVSDFYDRFEATVTSHSHTGATDECAQNTNTLSLVPADDGNDKRFIITDLRIHLTNVRAVVPLFTKDLSYINSALIRPIVAYINSRHTFIPIHCRLVKRLSDFDGSWTVFDSGLMDDLSAAVRIPNVHDS